VKSWVAVAAVLALFLVGIGVGILGTHLYLLHARGPADGPAPGAARFHARMERALDLTEEQKRQVRAILRDSRREADALHREMLPRVRAHMEATADRIREVLTPEQRERFDEFRRRQGRRAEHFFLGSGRRPHGPSRPRRPPPEPPPEPPPGSPPED
jgi:Spy/CpxP family protein refolding chaperone